MMASCKTVTLATGEERHDSAFVLIEKSDPLPSITNAGSDPEVQ